MRRPALLTGLVAAMALLPASALLAHPAFDPDQLPVGEPVDATLVVPHGCATGDTVMPEEGEAVPTTRFDLQLVDGVSLQPGDVDGWEHADDGEAIVWTDAGGATTDPIELPVTVTVTDASPGDTILLSAYQECEDGSSYRWTPGAEDTPPVRLEVTAGGTGAGDGSQPDHGPPDEPGEAGGTADDGPTGTGTPDVATDAATDAAAADEGGGVDGATVAAVLAVAVAVAAGVASLVRRKETA